MTPEALNKLIADTRADAISFIEDFDHLKLISDKAQTIPVDLRHASGILRRWLIEGLLLRTANPRVGRIEIIAIDNNPVYRAFRNQDIHSFVSGGASVHGIYVAAGMVNRGSVAPRIEGYHPDKTIVLRLESFIKQKVIYTSGTWVTRGQVIKYVANVDHGVHGGRVKADWEKLLSEFRQHVSVQLVKSESGDTIPSFGWRLDGPASASNPRGYDPSEINGTLLEILATISFVISSPDIEKLANTIRLEL